MTRDKVLLNDTEVQLILTALNNIRIEATNENYQHWIVKVSHADLIHNICEQTGWDVDFYFKGDSKEGICHEEE